MKITTRFYVDGGASGSGAAPLLVIAVTDTKGIPPIKDEESIEPDVVPTKPAMTHGVVNKIVAPTLASSKIKREGEGDDDTY